MTTTTAQPTKRLTERQQLALALAESTRDCPADALIANKVSPSSSSSSDGETDDDDDQHDQQSDQDEEEKEQNDDKKNKKKSTTTTRKLSPKNAKQPQQLQVPMSRQQKELAKLAPWAWDPLVSRHAPGPSALRDFSEVLPSSGVKHKPRATMMTPTAARPALKATFGSLTGSAKNKKAEKEKENVVPSPPLSKNIVGSSANNDAAKKSSNTANTKAVSGGAKRKTAVAENTPKTPAVDAVATKKVRKNAASNAEKVAAATKKEEEKIEKEKEIPATAIATKKRSTIAASRGKKGAVATEEPKTVPQKRAQKSEQITPVAFELEPASGAESNKKSGEKNLKRSAVNAAGATTDTVVPATAAKGARGKKAAVIIDTPVVTAKKKLNLQTPGATTVENNNNDNKRKAVVAEREAAVTVAKKLNPSTKKRKKDSGVDITAVGTKDSKLDPSKLVPPEFQQRQLTPEERKERRDKFWVFLETIKVRPPKENSVLLKEAIPSHKLYQSFCFATGRIAREAFNPTDAAATRKQGFARVTLSSSRQYEDEDEGAASLARRVRLVPMSQSLRIAVRALK